MPPRRCGPGRRPRRAPARWAGSARRPLRPLTAVSALAAVSKQPWRPGHVPSFISGHTSAFHTATRVLVASMAWPPGPGRTSRAGANQLQVPRRCPPHEHLPDLVLILPRVPAGWVPANPMPSGPLRSSASSLGPLLRAPLLPRHRPATAAPSSRLPARPARAPPHRPRPDRISWTISLIPSPRANRSAAFSSAVPAAAARGRVTRPVAQTACLCLRPHHPTSRLSSTSFILGLAHLIGL